MTLRCCTANVLTLYPSDVGYGSFVTARQESLVQQFSDLSAHVIGVQETRSKADGHFVIGHYHVLSAAATSRGHEGLQLWIRQQWETANGPINIRPTHLRILHSSSRRLVVYFQYEDLRFIFILGHAPSNVPEADYRAWWAATTAAVPHNLRHFPMIVLADATHVLGNLFQIILVTIRHRMRTFQAPSFTNGYKTMTCLCCKHFPCIIPAMVTPGFILQDLQHDLTI